MSKDLIERMRAVAARTNDPLLTEAAAALEAAREDAERYRWLRMAHGSHVHGMWHVRQYDNTVIGQQPEELDAAIDQARGKGVAGEA